MNHIKRYNEEYEVDTKGVHFFNYNNRNKLEQADIDRIHTEGKKLFIYNTDYELVEILKEKQLLKLRVPNDMRKYVPCKELNVIMFLTKWELSKVKPMSDNIFELKKAHEEEISLRLTQMRQIVLQKLI